MNYKLLIYGQVGFNETKILKADADDVVYSNVNTRINRNSILD